MKTIVRVMWIHEADMIKAKLELQDIQAFIPDEGMSNTIPIMGNTIGGVRVQVADEDYDRAREILEIDRKEKAECCVPCPSCGSRDVDYMRMTTRMFLGSLLLLGFPFLWMKSRYSCNACGQKWAGSKDDKIVE